MSETTLAERIKYVRINILGIYTQKEFAEKLNTTKIVISNIETGKTDTLNKNILKILTVNYDINGEWLLTGKGEPKGRNIEDYIKLFKSSYTFPVPFYNVKAAAGNGNILPDYEEKDVLFFDIRYLKNILNANPVNLSLILADGDSMDSGENRADDIKDEDLLLVDNSQKEPINGRIFVIRKNDKLFVKKIKKDIAGNITLLSNNPKYSPIELTPFDNAEIIGKVIWNGSREHV